MFVFARTMAPVLTGLAVLSLGAVMMQQTASPGTLGEGDDIVAIAAIDTRYQAAVERNDAATMASILHPRFTLVLGDGRRFTRDDLLRAANAREVVYDRQVEDAGTQVVLVQGDTAIVTARLWNKGRGPRGPFDHRLWFSDTYVRTPEGWRYLFGQASLPMP